MSNTVAKHRKQVVGYLIEWFHQYGIVLDTTQVVLKYNQRSEYKYFYVKIFFMGHKIHEGNIDPNGCSEEFCPPGIIRSIRYLDNVIKKVKIERERQKL